MGVGDDSEQFKAELKMYKKKFRVHSTEEILPEELTWLKNRVLEQTVHNTLLRQEIKKNEIEISQEELDEALLKAEAGYSNDSFKKQLEFEGMTGKEWVNIASVEVSPSETAMLPMKALMRLTP